MDGESAAPRGSLCRRFTNLTVEGGEKKEKKEKKVFPCMRSQPNARNKKCSSEAAARGQRSPWHWLNDSPEEGKSPGAALLKPRPTSASSQGQQVRRRGFGALTGRTRSSCACPFPPARGLRTPATPACPAPSLPPKGSAVGETEERADPTAAGAPDPRAGHSKAPEGTHGTTTSTAATNATVTGVLSISTQQKDRRAARSRYSSEHPPRRLPPSQDPQPQPGVSDPSAAAPAHPCSGCSSITRRPHPA